MFSYRHAFHAGNHADVLKHTVLIHTLQYLIQKEKALSYIDTHAGAGIYEIDRGYAAHSNESSTGVARLWDKLDLPPGVSDYIEMIRSFNPNQTLRYYPGSPWCALHLLRAHDRINLFELHPTDYQLLQQNLGDLGLGRLDRRTRLHQSDGFTGAKAYLPPISKRGLLLADPSYENKQDYHYIMSLLEDALKRFASGTYVVWYPLLKRLEVRHFQEKIKALPNIRYLHVSLSVSGGASTVPGLQGSAMFVINPPWTLQPMLEQALPYLVDVLAVDKQAFYTLESKS